MPDYQISFIHKGRERVAVIYGDDYRDAYESFKSMQATGVIGDEIVQIIIAPGLQFERVGQ